MAKSARVFISYAHDSEQHKAKVLALANRLRADGVDAHLDRYYENDSVDWPKWMRREIKQADYVLCVGSPLYIRRVEGEEEPGKGKGAKWEGAVITQLLYEAEGNDTKMIPVVLAREDETHIPLMLRGPNRFLVEDDHGYESLFRRLTEQPRVVMPPIGTLRVLATETTEAVPPPEHDARQADVHDGGVAATAPVVQQVVPTETERANKVLALGYTGPAAFCGRFALLDSGEQAYVVRRLLLSIQTPITIEALGCVATGPKPPLRLTVLASDAMAAAVLSDDVGVLAAMMATWPESALAAADQAVREAFFGEVIRIMEADQYSDVNRITPTVVKVHTVVPESLHTKYVDALLSQARSGAFQGRPAAEAALAALPTSLAREALSRISESTLMLNGDDDGLTLLLENHKDLWPVDRTALFAEFLDLGYERFVESRIPLEW